MLCNCSDGDVTEHSDKLFRTPMPHDGCCSNKLYMHNVQRKLNVEANCVMTGACSIQASSRQPEWVYLPGAVIGVRGTTGSHLLWMGRVGVIIEQQSIVWAGSIVMHTACTESKV